MPRSIARSTTKSVPAILVAALIVSLAPASAHALSLRVKIACASDYYAYCSEHRPGSAAVRRCMKAHGAKLSQRCVRALVKAGEVSKSYVDNRRAAAKTASR